MSEPKTAHYHCWVYEAAEDGPSRYVKHDRVFGSRQSCNRYARHQEAEVMVLLCRLDDCQKVESSEPD